MALKNLVAVIGTTGVGKSKLSVALAKALDGEIINADAMQTYAGVPILTNKHPEAEREGVPHHLLGHIPDVTAEYTVPQFEREASACVDEICGRGKVPIVVGGTHYYVQSLLLGSTVAGAAAVVPSREVSAADAAVLDGDTRALWERLQAVDPAIAQKFHPRDHRKLRRALEIYLTTGTRASDLYAAQAAASADSVRYRALVLWVWSEQGALDGRLDARVDAMDRGGLGPEVAGLHAEYVAAGEPPLDRGLWQAIGFKEFLPFLASGDAQTRAACVDDMKRATRRYARTQTKWIRKKLLVAAAAAPADLRPQTALLDATDLAAWDERVAARAVGLARRFLAGETLGPADLAPDAAAAALLAPARDADLSRRPDDWQHFACAQCAVDGEPFVCVGAELWKQHLTSRRHRLAVKRERGRAQHAAWLARQAE
ncbi:IPP transferase-domain-containing protein [Dipodascopsis tothii]|uniref:IPP transferase-domain-containing protein n=1 Tax=Dipodascopsis tothii TaxID=44089 RepID=UPI0034CDDD80